MIGKCYRHKKRGSVYQITDMITLQSSKLPDIDGWTLVIYKNLMSEVSYARELTEFFDGRFEEVK